MKITGLISALLCSCLISCVSQFETMGSGGPRGNHYTYHYGQIGGQGTAQSSMGTAVAFDGQKSFADLMQAWTAGKLSTNALKGRVSDNAVAMHREGELTTRQLAEFKSKVDLAETGGQVEVAIAGLRR